jgi:hypothetical protein
LRLVAFATAVFSFPELRAIFGGHPLFAQRFAEISQEIVRLRTATTGAEEPLYMLTYDHGGAVLWGIDSFVKNLRSAVAWLEHYPSFKIGLDNEAYTYDLLADQHPDVLEELRGYLKRFPGRFAIGTATYGQPLSRNWSRNMRASPDTAGSCWRNSWGCFPSPKQRFAPHLTTSQYGCPGDTVATRSGIAAVKLR